MAEKCPKCSAELMITPAGNAVCFKCNYKGMASAESIEGEREKQQEVAREKEQNKAPVYPVKSEGKDGGAVSTLDSKQGVRQTWAILTMPIPSLIHKTGTPYIQKASWDCGFSCLVRSIWLTEGLSLRAYC